MCHKTFLTVLNQSSYQIWSLKPSKDIADPWHIPKRGIPSFPEYHLPEEFQMNNEELGTVFVWSDVQSLMVL